MQWDPQSQQREAAPMQGVLASPNMQTPTHSHIYTQIHKRHINVHSFASRAAQSAAHINKKKNHNLKIKKCSFNGATTSVLKRIKCDQLGLFIECLARMHAALASTHSTTTLGIVVCAVIPVLQG